MRPFQLPVGIPLPPSCPFTSDASADMDRNSFSLRAPGPGAPRASTAVPVERPWNPPPRRTFSSHTPQTDRANAEALANIVDRLDDPPAYLREDAKMHKPFSNPRFGSLRIPSADGTGIEMDEQGSLDPSQGDSARKDSMEEDLGHDDETASREEDGMDGQLSSQEHPSFSHVQDVIDSMWQINRMPEQLQEGFDGMKEEIHNRISELSMEKRTSSKLARDLEELQRQVKTVKKREKERERQNSTLEDALQVSSSKCDSLWVENEKLRSEAHRERQSFDKTRNDLEGELANLSQDLATAKKDLQQKEGEHELVHGEVIRLKQKNEDDVKRRESVLAESQIFKRDLIELRKRGNEQKREWIASQEENQACIKELQEVNNALTVKRKDLEDIVLDRNASIEELGKDLMCVLSFLRNICDAHRQVHQAARAHGHPGLAEAMVLPRSTCLMLGEECDHEIFGQLFQVLKYSPSAEKVMELSSAYGTALSGFFRDLVMRGVAQSHFISSSHEALKGLQLTHTRVRECFEVKRKIIKDLSTELSLDLQSTRDQASKLIQASEHNVRCSEQEKLVMRAELEFLKDRSMTIRGRLSSCRMFLTSEVENLRERERLFCGDFRDLIIRLSKETEERKALHKQLEEAKTSVGTLKNAASSSGIKQKEMENSLKCETERFRTVLTKQEARLKETSQSEAKLRETNEKLACSSRQATADSEEKGRRMADLSRKNEKLASEKDDALKRVVEAENAVQNMSEKVAEALAAKQHALEALISERTSNEQLLRKLSKVPEATSNKTCNRQEISLPKAIPCEPQVQHSDQNKNGSRHDDAASETVRVGGLFKGQSEKLGLQSASKQPQRETDPCEHELVPKKTKRRASSKFQRKSSRQKRVRSNQAKMDTTAIDPKPISASKASLPRRDDMPQESSTPEATRDEEWYIECNLGMSD